MKTLDIPVCSRICVGHFVLPLHFQQFAKAVEMETTEFLCVPLVDSPGLAGIQ